MGLGETYNNGWYMPVMPAGSYGGNGGGFFGGDWAWILLLLLIGGNGWGFGGGFGGGMMWPMMMSGMGGWAGLDYLYPWLNNSQHISDGFRDQQLQSSINGVQNTLVSGFGDVQLGIAGVNQAICQTGNTITGAVRDGFSAAEIAANGRQMANMQQAFGLQSTMQGGFANNAAATADLKYTVATEACNDRAAISGALNSLLTHIDQKVQGVQDKLCQLELDGYKRENNALRDQLNMANLKASQVEQTYDLRQGQINAVDSLYNRLKNCPVGTYSVCNPLVSQPTCNGCGGAFGFNAA